MKKLFYFSLVFFILFTQIKGQPDSGSVKDINGAKLFIREIGKGEPVIVVHGGPGLFHDYFLPHMEKLAKKRKLIFFDQRGNGLSEVPGGSVFRTLY